MPSLLHHLFSAARFLVKLASIFSIIHTSSTEWSDKNNVRPVIGCRSMQQSAYFCEPVLHDVGQLAHSYLWTAHLIIPLLFSRLSRTSLLADLPNAFLQLHLACCLFKIDQILHHPPLQHDSISPPASQSSIASAGYLG